MVQVGVDKITLNGRVRMTLKPLMDELPIVAAIQVRSLGSALVVSQATPPGATAHCAVAVLALNQLCCTILTV